MIVGDMMKIPLSLVYLAIVAGTLSLTEMGIVAALAIFLRLLRRLSNPGLSSALVTYTSEGMSKGQDVSTLIRKIVLIGIGLSGLISIGFFAAGGAFQDLILKSHLSSLLFQIVIVDAFLSCISPYVNGTLMGLKAFKSLKLTDTASYYIGQIAGIVLVINGMGATGVVIGWVLGDGTYLIQTLLAIKTTLARYSPHSKLQIPNFQELLRYSIPVFLSDLIAFGSEWFDRLFILAFFPLDQLAIYNVAYSILGVASGFPSYVADVLLPHFSEQYGKGGKPVLESMSRDASRYVALIFTPIFLGIAALSTPAMILVGGPKYAGGAMVLVILCIFTAFTVSAQGFGQAFYVLKRTHIPLFASAVSALAGFVLSLALAQPYGIFGIALALGITLLVGFLLELWSLNKLCSIRLDVTPLAEVFLCGSAMALLVYTLQQAYLSNLSIVLYVTIGVISYLLLIRQACLLRRHDFDLIRELLGSKAKSFVDITERLLVPKSRL